MSLNAAMVNSPAVTTSAVYCTASLASRRVAYAIAAPSSVGTKKDAASRSRRLRGASLARKVKIAANPLGDVGEHLPERERQAEPCGYRRACTQQQAVAEQVGRDGEVAHRHAAGSLTFLADRAFDEALGQEVQQAAGHEGQAEDPRCCHVERFGEDLERDDRDDDPGGHVERAVEPPVGDREALGEQPAGEVSRGRQQGQQRDGQQFRHNTYSCCRA